MNTVIPDSKIIQAERPFSVHFSSLGADDRVEAEQFISDVFHQAYGARIRYFMPCLMSLRDHDNKLVAACGFRSATREPLFLERYLDQPIEAVISERIGSPVGRGDIIEVGNFSVTAPGVARYLIAALVDQFHVTSKQWAVFTAVPLVRNVLAKAGLKLVVIGDADKSRLPTGEQPEWGSYYAQKPQIMMLQRIEKRRQPQTAGTCTPESVTGKCSQACI